MVIIPKNVHNTAEYNQAKQIELEKFKHFSTYANILDKVLYRIPKTWVLYSKINEVYACLLARGYEESAINQNDSPTVSKIVMRILVAITVQNKWKTKTIDMKPANLQGKQLTRNVYIQPPQRSNGNERTHLETDPLFAWVCMGLQIKHIDL